MTAFAFNLFSSLAGDELSLCADYQGNGLVSITVENKSEKVLKFQPQLKLMRWSTGEEIQPDSDDIVFTSTEIQPHTSGVMTIDLSQAYDIALLEQPLNGDHYYFVLTNNDFLFGQDWMCTVYFSEPAEVEIEYPEETVSVENNAELSEQIMEQLKPYFEEYVTNPDEYRKRAEEYFALCNKLLAEAESDIVPTVSPLELAVDIPIGELPVFDDTIPEDQQHLLISENRFSLDGYHLPIGASMEDSALVISAIVPQYQGDTTGGTTVPLIYIFTYETDAAAEFTTVTEGVLTMATNAEFPPYEYYEGDTIVGIDAEVAQLIADELGLTLEIADIAFDSIVPGVQSGKYDIGMAGMTIDEKRLESVNFSTPYATGIQAVIVTEDSDITSVDDLAGKTIGVQTNTTGDIKACEDFGMENVVQYDNGAMAVEGLKSGKVDCVIIDNEPAKSYAAANEGLKVLETEYAVEEYAICFSKENAALQEAVNGVLEDLIADGSVQEIVDKYIKAE